MIEITPKSIDKFRIDMEAYYVYRNMPSLLQFDYKDAYKKKVYLNDGGNVTYSGYKKTLMIEPYSIKYTGIMMYGIQNESVMVFEHTNYLLMIERVWPIIRGNVFDNEGDASYYLAGDKEMLGQHMVQATLSRF